MEHPTILKDSSSCIDRVNYEKWECSNCVSLMTIKHSILKALRGIVFEKITNAKEFFVKKKKRFVLQEHLKQPLGI